MYVFISSQIINENYVYMIHIDQEIEHWLRVIPRNPWTEAEGLLYTPG